jgi:hypothetical protein
MLALTVRCEKARNRGKIPPLVLEPGIPSDSLSEPDVFTKEDYILRIPSAFVARIPENPFDIFDSWVNREKS